MKNSAAKLINKHRYHRNWLAAARSRELGIGGCDKPRARGIMFKTHSRSYLKWLI
ncbi:hypothetical protein HanIR_Chr03g0107381 [Helianthus annuus]|nr:hypothetical protein HanIR_Chr03g0107381 [Helianthus annuus]